MMSRLSERHHADECIPRESRAPTIVCDASGRSDSPFVTLDLGFANACRAAALCHPRAAPRPSPPPSPARARMDEAVKLTGEAIASTSSGPSPIKARSAGFSLHNHDDYTRVPQEVVD